MQIVIDIPEEEYNYVKTQVTFGITNPLKMRIANGTPLPKGHGRLVDADAFITKMKDASKRYKYKELLIDNFLTVDDVFDAIIESLQNEGLAEGDTPTIIEADKEDKNE